MAYPGSTSALTFLIAATLAGAGGASAATQCGKAAWFDLEGITASGEPADASELTAAHRSLPFQTRVKVENLANGQSVIVRINDRGPFVKGRVIDVSRAAAERLDFIGDGITRVRLSVIDGDAPRLPNPCGSADGEEPIVTAALTVDPDLPGPRLRPRDFDMPAAEIGGDLPNPGDDAGLDPNAPVGDPIVDDPALRFADAFAPIPDKPDLLARLREKADADPEPPPVIDPHHGIAKREDWDRLQQLPE
ncbi:septal ring lytic transglycosylase RlpA family protein [Bauldia sp.]|uniref:septal ring lytic transglycosylase RlpA family protein n=1 Tax=Bauldia sp. TaxID=2575872 RepID=UPI003BAC458F